jgi:hypothetical protein
VITRAGSEVRPLNRSFEAKPLAVRRNLKGLNMTSQISKNEYREIKKYVSENLDAILKVFRDLRKEDRGGKADRDRLFKAIGIPESIQKFSKTKREEAEEILYLESCQAVWSSENQEQIEEAELANEAARCEYKKFLNNKIKELTPVILEYRDYIQGRINAAERRLKDAVNNAAFDENFSWQQIPVKCFVEDYYDQECIDYSCCYLAILYTRHHQKGIFEYSPELQEIVNFPKVDKTADSESVNWSAIKTEQVSDYFLKAIEERGILKQSYNDEDNAAGSNEPSRNPQRTGDPEKLQIVDKIKEDFKKNPTDFISKYRRGCNIHWAGIVDEYKFPYSNWQRRGESLKGFMQRYCKRFYKDLKTYT